MRYLNPTGQAILLGCHFFIASTIVFGFRLLGWPVWACGLMVLAWSVPKEFLWDIYQEPDTYRGSVGDFLEYLAGGAAAVGVLYLGGWLGTL